MSFATRWALFEDSIMAVEAAMKRWRDGGTRGEFNDSGEAGQRECLGSTALKWGRYCDVLVTPFGPLQNGAGPAEERLLTPFALSTFRDREVK